MAHVLPHPRRTLRWRRTRGWDSLAALLIVAVLVVGVRLAAAPPDAAEAAVLPPPVEAPADVVGAARVIDGDGLWVDGVEIRLSGIDAFELRQTCGEVECGVEARRALHRMVADRTVACRFVDQDRYGRQVSTCSVDGVDIGGVLVRGGNAVAYTKYSDAYVEAEAAARSARIGAWASEARYISPSEWRQLNS